MSHLDTVQGTLPIWGGVESTVNRVQDRYFDQIRRTGHHNRIDDLDRFAELGIAALRYPILWERCSPDGVELDWTWTDARMGRLRELELKPIAGLVHHGSGPPNTNLLDPAFSHRLADFALRVAERYSWIDDYTPVNEPLTTARFSALYGFWYPHATTDHAFAMALLNQCKATVLSMRAIRSVNPEARLIQTEDVGETFSTPALAYQADFQNERRWLTFDLLNGSLAPGMPMWEWLRFVGVSEHDLHWFRENPCPPDIIGLNYYLTSDRYLDERVGLYPGIEVGTNGKESYVDVAAVRALANHSAAIDDVIRDTWNRYGIPIAITEVHNGSTVDHQMRWLHDIWQSAHRARAAGIAIKAVTAWALVGMYDWHCLLRNEENVYESGAFDVPRYGPPRPTALATMIHDLAQTGEHHHPHLETPGWWKHPERLIYKPRERELAIAD